MESHPQEVDGWDCIELTFAWVAENPQLVEQVEHAVNYHLLGSRVNGQYEYVIDVYLKMIAISYYSKPGQGG